MIRFFRSILALTLLVAGFAIAADMNPDELVKSTTEDVITVIKQDKDIQAGNRAKIFALVEEKVLPHFDFKRMTQLAMGKNWRQATPEQQEALITQRPRLATVGRLADARQTGGTAAARAEPAAAR